MPNILNLKQKNKPEPVEEKEISQKEIQPKETEAHLEWTAPEFEYYQKDKSWFLITGIIAAGLFLWAVFTKNILFALLIGLSYFTIASYTLKKPRDINLAITPRGIKINKTLYEFENLKSFWIFYDPPQIKEISFRSKKTVMSYIKIPLGDQNPVEVRKILIKYISEKKHKESVIENLARQAKF